MADLPAQIETNDISHKLSLDQVHWEIEKSEIGTKVSVSSPRFKILVM